MSTLLVYPPYEGKDKHLPLGIGYLAASLEKAGHSVCALDMSVCPAPWKSLEEKIDQTAPRIVGFSFMTPMATGAVRAARSVKSKNGETFVVVGGPHASAVPEDVLNSPEIDCVVLGEGEETFLHLAKKILNGKQNELREVKGLAFRGEEGTINTGRRDLIGDLDSIPFPARHLFDQSAYSARPLGLVERNSPDHNKNVPVFNMISSRGCPNKCFFCDSHSVFLRKFRPRSAENIVAEIKKLVKDYGMKYMDFVDDTITVQKKRMMKLCDLIIGEGLDHLRWSCNVRANTVDLELLEKMYAGGCRRVEMGVESGDPELLKTMHKNITLDQLRQAFRQAKQAKLVTTGFFMIGLPGQDRESVMKTMRFIETIDCDMPCFSLATPFPGTELYGAAEEKGLIVTREWDKYLTTGDIETRVFPMKSDVMSEDELRKLYREAVDFAAKFTVRSMYGKYFFLNPALYKDLLRRKNILREWQTILKQGLKLLPFGKPKPETNKEIG